MLNHMYLNEGIQHLVLKTLEVQLVGDSGCAPDALSKNNFKLT